MTLYPHMYRNVHCNLLQKNFSIQEWPLYKGLELEKYGDCFVMVGIILKATNSSFQRGIAFCRSIHVKKVMKLLAFIFEQPSYFITSFMRYYCNTYGPIVWIKGFNNHKRGALPCFVI